MTTDHVGWDWWSEVKLQVLAGYLNAFTRAVRGRSREAIYLDLFAGSFVNERRHGSGTFPGSSQVALDANPQFTRLALFELPGPAERLRQAIEEARPGDRRWSVFAGDCNDTLPRVLASLEDIRWAPTFAFLDPRGLQVAWGTVASLAAWRSDKRTKVEQWILMPEPALARVLGLRGVAGRRSADRLDRLFGSRQWLPIHQGRREGILTPEEMRAEFVNLYRWQLEQELGYRTTHALQIVNTAGHPVYTLVFATDSAPGDRIMSHLYSSAATSMIPGMQARAQIARQQRRDQEAGRQRLPGFAEFEIDVAKADPYEYRHFAPWPPAPIVDESLDLQGEADIDPDEIEWGDDSDLG